MKQEEGLVFSEFLPIYKTMIIVFDFVKVGKNERMEN